MELTTQLLCLKTVWPQKQVSLFMQRAISYMERSRNKMVTRVLKNLPANAEDVRDVGSISGWGRSPGGRHGNPLQYSCLKNPTEEPGGLQSWDHTELDRTEVTWHVVREMATETERD